MVGIGQKDVGAGFFKLLGCNSFDRPGGTHGHENRCLDRPVGGGQQAQPGGGAGVLMENLKARHFNIL